MSAEERLAAAHALKRIVDLVWASLSPAERAEMRAAAAATAVAIPTKTKRPRREPIVAG